MPLGLAVIIVLVLFAIGVAGAVLYLFFTFVFPILLVLGIVYAIWRVQSGQTLTDIWVEAKRAFREWLRGLWPQQAVVTRTEYETRTIYPIGSYIACGLLFVAFLAIPPHFLHQPPPRGNSQDFPNFMVGWFFPVVFLELPLFLTVAILTVKFAKKRMKYIEETYERQQRELANEAERQKYLLIEQMHVDNVKAAVERHKKNEQQVVASILKEFQNR